MLKTKNKQKKRNTKQFKKQLNKKTNKMNNQNNPEMKTNSTFIIYKSDITLKINGKDLKLEVKDGNQGKLNLYNLGLIDIEEHLGQKLYFQFYCENIDYNYTIMYDNSKGFQYQEFLKTDEKIIGKQIGVNTLYEGIKKVKNEFEFNGQVSENTILSTDILLSIYVKNYIINYLKMMFDFKKSIVKPPVNMFKNVPRGTSDFMFRIEKNEDGKFKLKMDSNELSHFNKIQNLNN
jgi:hypothetical protein